MPRTDTYNVSHPGVELFFWSIEESAEELAAMIKGGRAMLSDACSMFKSEQRRREWLATRALLQHSGRLGSITYRPDGAPCLEGRSEHISISHTKGLAAMAISPQPVGIDIEEAGRDASKVIKMLTDDCNAVPGKKEALRMWTAKEAAFKLYSGCIYTVKEILLEKEEARDGMHSYKANYPDGTTARCNTYETGGHILAVAECNE